MGTTDAVDYDRPFSRAQCCAVRRLDVDHARCRAGTQNSNWLSVRHTCLCHQRIRALKPNRAIDTLPYGMEAMV